MKENALFYAYRNSPPIDASRDNEQAELDDETKMHLAAERASSVKCHWTGCPTMLAVGTGKILCNFHQRKRREGR